jgi:hypothetical protein
MFEVIAVIESGFWIFIVEALVAGSLFVGLIWWVVRGTSAKDRAKMDEARRRAKVQGTDDSVPHADNDVKDTRR